MNYEVHEFLEGLKTLTHQSVPSVYIFELQSVLLGEDKTDSPAPLAFAHLGPV